MKPAEFYHARPDALAAPRPMRRITRQALPAQPRVRRFCPCSRRSLSEITGPTFGHDDIAPLDNDLDEELYAKWRRCRWASGSSCCTAASLDENNAPRAEYAGRDLAGQRGRAAIGTRKDTYLGPHRPQLSAVAGARLTDENGYYFFRTVKPGRLSVVATMGEFNWRPAAYPRLGLRNRPFAQRLITQMYFEGDPLIAALSRSCRPFPDPEGGSNNSSRPWT